MLYARKNNECPATRFLVLVEAFRTPKCTHTHTLGTVYSTHCQMYAKLSPALTKDQGPGTSNNLNKYAHKCKLNECKMAFTRVEDGSLPARYGLWDGDWDREWDRDCGWGLWTVERNLSREAWPRLAQFANSPAAFWPILFNSTLQFIYICGRIILQLFKKYYQFVCSLSLSLSRSLR